MKTIVYGLTLLWVTLIAAGCGTDGTLSGANPGAVANADGGAGADGSIGNEDGTSRAAADAAPELGSPVDVGSPDAADAAPQAGAFEAPCTDNSDCESALCLITEKGTQCSKSCTSNECGAGYTCKQWQPPGSSDITFACQSRWTKLCNPCTDDGDCNTGGSLGNRCLPWGGAGNFCGSECASKADCPQGYACEQYLEGGKPIMQCKPAGGAACSCNLRAQIQKASTTCFNESAPLSCKGTRACGVGGLSPCSIPQKPEVCNGLDDDCDSATDEGTCEDGNICTTDECSSGSCKHEQLQGTPCDDGNACTATDKCGGSGKCVGGELKACDDNNVCTDNTCDPAGGCLFSSNKDPCNDNDACTLKDVCAEKKCGGSVPPNCDDKNQCTDDFCDAAKGCIHKAATKTDGAVCDDGNVCTKDGCIGGKCAHVVDKSKPGCS